MKRLLDERWLLAAATLVLAVAAVVLGLRLAGEDDEEPGDVVEAGAVRALDRSPYATQHAFELPNLRLLVQVADPVKELDGDFVESLGDHPDLRAEEGATLVPVAWQLSALGFDLPQDQDPDTPVTIRLLAGNDSTELTTLTREDAAAAFTSRVVAMPGDLSADDLRLEVEYDGLTQTLVVGSRRLDAGAAGPLYEPPRALDTGCSDRHLRVMDFCYFEVPNSGRIRPDEPRFRTDDVVLRAYDTKHGWAEPGTVWASVEVNSFIDRGDTRSGDFRLVTDLVRTRVTLDGEDPVFTTQDGEPLDVKTTTALFRVPVDATPEVLRIRHEVKFEGGAVVPVRAKLSLRPAD